MSTSTPATEAATPASDESKTERVYRDLRRRIRQMELQPGSRLPKNEIAQQYRVSRAPVSEAIARLADEGLVDVFPQRGSFVAPIRLEDIRECFLIRAGLEVETARRVAQLGDEQLLEALDRNLDEQAAAMRAHDMEALDDLDEAFHIIIMAAVSSPRAMRLLDVTRAVLDRPRFHALHGVGRAEDTLTEHRRIVDAIRSGDSELAAAAMRLHISMVARTIESEFARVERQTQLDRVG